MPSPCDASVIIPQRNLGALTKACIESLRRCDGADWPLIVVDDGSQDSSAELIETSAASNCRVIRQPPRGVTAAWNAGLHAAATPFVVLLNNDVLCDGPLLDSLLAPLRDRHALIAGVEWRIEPLLPPHLITRLPSRRLTAGWCFAFEAKLWSALNGFDESLKVYFSDTDFQIRAAELSQSVQATFAVLPALPLRHLGHQTTRHEPRRSAIWRADRTTFLQKWSMKSDTNRSTKPCGNF